MKPSCLVKSLSFAAAAAFSARADILPPDSHLVPRTVSLVNTGDYPGQVFVALEFFPGNPEVPVAATPMSAGKEAKVTGYKLDYLHVYAANLADWPAVQAKLGLIGSESGPAADWKAGLTLVAGDVQAGPQFAANSSPLKSEIYEYKVAGATAESLSLYASLQSYADGSQKEVPLSATALRASSRAMPDARMAADGRSLLWVPRHSGVASLSLLDAAGRRAWSARRVAIAGVSQSVALPANLTQAKYLVTVQGRGWSQSGWLEPGKR
jgi:hypothetical protein